MKILAIMGSPRGMQGNTGRLLEEVQAGAAEGGAEIETVLLSRAAVRPCVGCDACHRTGACAIDDDFEPIKEKLLAYDGFVLASPNYIFSVTAQLKAFVDRCNGLIHCMALKGKYGAVVETSGGGGDKEVIGYMERCIGTLGAYSVGGIGSPVAGMRSFPGQEDLFRRARELGRDLCLAIAQRRAFPQQEAFHRAFGERMGGLVEAMKNHWPYEYDYWQNNIDR